MEGWAGFTQDMRQYYGVDMGCLNEEYRREQQEYFLETSAWADVHPSQLLGSPACFKRYDLLTVTLEEVAAPLKARMRPALPICAELHNGHFLVVFGLQLGWFALCLCLCKVLSGERSDLCAGRVPHGCVG